MFRESRWRLSGVVDSDRMVPVATAVWGKDQTLRRSHYFVRAAFQTRGDRTLERVRSL